MMDFLFWTNLYKLENINKLFVVILLRKIVALNKSKSSFLYFYHIFFFFFFVLSSFSDLFMHKRFDMAWNAFEFSSCGFYLKNICRRGHLT